MIHRIGGGKEEAPDKRPTMANELRMFADKIEKGEARPVGFVLQVYFTDAPMVMVLRSSEDFDPIKSIGGLEVMKAMLVRSVDR